MTTVRFNGYLQELSLIALVQFLHNLSLPIVSMQMTNIVTSFTIFTRILSGLRLTAPSTQMHFNMPENGCNYKATVTSRISHLAWHNKGILEAACRPLGCYKQNKQCCKLQLQHNTKTKRQHRTKMETKTRFSRLVMSTM